MVDLNTSLLRKKAQELRALAENTKSYMARDAFIKMAEAYVALADKLEPDTGTPMDRASRRTRRMPQN